MRSELPEHQVRSGDEVGSWDPQGDHWGSVAGRLYTTCLSIYMLEVYYRHLPIYSAYRYGEKVVSPIKGRLKTRVARCQAETDCRRLAPCLAR